ncbi:MAG TPA: aldehyde dehydrogenase family protein [Virgibacillus sp.]|nr:aldehyde dehydrogenase family protein [Virgibacillus sp.]HLR66807.1 aldehyde dehydrogenase family protein [Virgibacillus sp.]
MTIFDITLDGTYDLFIDGEFQKPSNDYFQAINPANGETLADVGSASSEDVDQAVKAARKAFPEWSKQSIEERSQYLHDIADALEENKERLSKIDCLDTGRPIYEFKSNYGDYNIAIVQFRYFASAILDFTGMSRPLKDGQLVVQKEPLGVCGQIIPWNVPSVIFSYKVAPALATGNTVVLNPSRDASLSSMEIAKLLSDILPAGVVNIVPGPGGETGQTILEHPDIDKLAFTGSTNIGKKVGKHAGERIIPVTLELGGKSPHIVFPDVEDIDRAVETVAFGFYFYNGQGCLNGTRLFLHDDIYGEFIDKLVKKVESLKIGDPTDPNTKISSAVSQKQGQTIMDYIEKGKQEGVNLLIGGHTVSVKDNDYGYFIEPTIFEATNDMTVAREEIFGPVLTVIRWNDYEQMIKEANDTPYGLAAGVITNSLDRAVETANRLQAGNIWINEYNNFQTGAPFGGYKNSGVGREYGEEALDMYTQSKMITMMNHLPPIGFAD